jgi:O-antigen/teichoic acid export membrane protein
VGTHVTTTYAEASAAPEVSRRGAMQVVRRLGWGVADQAISSLSNFALGIFVARTLGASSFGAFSLAFVTYSLVIHATRGLATDPLLVRYSGAVRGRWRRATSEATGTALTVGIGAGAICTSAGLLLPDPIGPVFVALGVGLPGLTLQDSWRFAFFARGRGSAAFINDLLWTVLLVLALLVVNSRGNGSAAVCLIIWGGTATLAAIFGSFQASVLPRLTRVTVWLRVHSDLSVRYLAENVSYGVAAQLRIFVLGAVAGLAAVGYVRAAEILVGPVLVVLSGISQVAVPEASRVFHRASGNLARFCFLLGSAQAAMALAWGVILLAIFDLGPGQVLIKELWMPTSQLLPAMTLFVTAVAFCTVATAGLRAMGQARRSLRAQLVASAAFLIGGAVGGILAGAVGTTWGVAAAQWLCVLVWWYQLRSALAEHHAGTGVPV